MSTMPSCKVTAASTIIPLASYSRFRLSLLLSFDSHFCLWGWRPDRHSDRSISSSRPLQLQPYWSFGCRRRRDLLVAGVILALLLLLLLLVWYGASCKNLHATQLCCRRFNSGVRCKPSSYFVNYRKLPPYGVAPCTRQQLGAASREPGLLVPPARSKSKATYLL